MIERRVYAFWGLTDLVYVGWFFYINFSKGKAPFYSDLQSFIELSPEHGLTSVLLFAMSFLLNVSIIFSTLLFFCGGRLAAHLAYAQIPLRLLFGVPSLSFALWFSKWGGMTSVLWLFGFLVLSETVKFFTILLRKRGQPGTVR